MALTTRPPTLLSSVTGLLPLLVILTSTPPLQIGSVKTSGTILPRVNTIHAPTFACSKLLVCVVMALSQMVLTISGTLQFTQAKIPANIATMKTKTAAPTALLTLSGSASMTLVMTFGDSAVADLCAEMVLFKNRTPMWLVMVSSMKNVILELITMTVMSTTTLAVLTVRRREPKQVLTYICGNVSLLAPIEMHSQLAPSFVVTVF